MTPTPPCVVFDLDDTLYLERDYVRSGLVAVGAAVAERCAIDGFATVAWEAFGRGVRGTLFDEALASLGVRPPPGLIGELVEIYRSHVPEISLLPDAAAAVAALQERSASIAVISDGPLLSQRAKAQAIDAEGWASLIVLTEELGEGRGKPHRSAFELVEQTLGFHHRECLYVADNPSKDFGGPVQLGWRTARVRRPGSLHEALASPSDIDREDADLWWISGAAAPAATTDEASTATSREERAAGA
jgi:putative hydrolase of the HAD superfamily